MTTIQLSTPGTAVISAVPLVVPEWALAPLPRCLVLNGQVANLEFTEPAEAILLSAHRAAQDFVGQIQERHPAGPAYSLDIVWEVDGEDIVVIEANTL